LKYGNVKTEVDGHIFSSKGEANRYRELKLLMSAGTIQNLTLQPRYQIIVNDVRVGSYVGDFFYFEGNKKVCEDFKGYKTPVYKLKIKLVRALYPNVDFREVK
jgi:hypothetical protein